MSTGYGWEGLRQVCATLLGARHVPERLCGRACLQRGAITSVRPFTFTFLPFFIESLIETRLLVKHHKPLVATFYGIARYSAIVRSLHLLIVRLLRPGSLYFTAEVSILNNLLLDRSRFD